MIITRFQTLALSLTALFGFTATALACGGGGPGDGNNGGGIIIQSRDPNEMEGPFGYGDPVTQRFVFPDEWMNYKIHFENMTNATASACEIRINASLSDNLDWSTFEFSEVNLGSQTDTTFFGKKGGEYVVPRQGEAFKLKMVFALNDTTGGLSCYLRAWDETQADQGYWPADVLAGILPPNDDTGRGEGYIAYRVKVKSAAASSARIDSSATIVFDTNDPITTDPAWWNLVTTPVQVWFDVQGGLMWSTFATVAAGATYSDLPAPSRVGYTFGGWWTGANGTGAAVTNGMPVTTTADLTLYAKWTAESYEVTLDAAGGSVDPATLTVTFEAPYGVLPVPVFAGHTFDGWLAETNGVRFGVSSASVVSIPTNHVLSASWSLGVFTVSFDAQGGAVSPGSKAVTFSEAYGALPVPLRAGVQAVQERRLPPSHLCRSRKDTPCLRSGRRTPTP